MKIWTAFVLLLFGAHAFAGDADLSWDHPTTYTDGSALLLSDIQNTRIEFGTCAGAAFGTKIGETTVTGTASTTVIRGLPPATYCFRAYVTAKNLESLASNVVSKVILQAPPSPPTNLHIT